jgi:hypothetical protein
MAMASTRTGPTAVASIPSKGSVDTSTPGSMVGSRSGSGSTGGSTWAAAGNGCPQTSQASPEGWTFSQSAQQAIRG